MSKILASRLASFLWKIIEEEQMGLVQGHSIATYVVLAQEMIRDLNCKSLNGNAMFKLDMAKAYYRLEWHFFFGQYRRLVSHQLPEI